MKKRTRILTLLLALSLLTASACSSGDSGTEDTSAASADTTAETTLPVEETLPVDANGYLLDDLPDDLDFGNEEVRIYVQSSTLESEFDAEDDGDIVHEAIYRRNLNVEERLGVDLAYFTTENTAAWAGRNNYLSTVRASVMANDGSIDIIGGLSLVMPTLAGEGHLLNLLGEGMDYLDFTKPWWNESLLSELAVQNRLYSVSGDASLGLIKGTICMFYNKSILEANQMEEPYELVSAGKWTLDTFHSMASAVYSDANGDGTADSGDRYGFEMLNQNHAMNFWYGCGLRITEKDEAGNIQLTYGSEKAAEVVMKVSAIMIESAFYNTEKNKGTLQEGQLFKEGRALFLAGQFGTAETMRDLDFDYGIIPFPKYDETQQDYTTHARNTMTGFGIPSVADPVITSAVLEAIASESYRLVTPAYYEEAMKVKYASDDTTSQMLDLIKNGICYDFGMWHYLVLGSNPPSAFIKNIMDGKGEIWASTVAAETPAINKALSVYLNKLLALEY